jgi:Uma2 family endonuclease
VFDAPLDVILGPHDIVEPDLLVVTDPSTASERAIEAAPALVVEILSPSTAVRDRTTKAARYAATGVAHYWIVDTERRRLECFRLEAGEYVRAVQAEGPATLDHPDWPGLTIDLAALWR